MLLLYDLIVWLEPGDFIPPRPFTTSPYFLQYFCTSHFFNLNFPLTENFILLLLVDLRKQKKKTIREFKRCSNWHLYHSSFYIIRKTTCIDWKKNEKNKRFLYFLKTPEGWRSHELQVIGCLHLGKKKKPQNKKKISLLWRAWYGTRLLVVCLCLNHRSQCPFQWPSWFMSLFLWSLPPNTHTHTLSLSLSLSHGKD